MPRELCDECVKRGEAVKDGDVDLELGDLTAEAPRGQALAERLGTVQFGFGAAPAMQALYRRRMVRPTLFDARNISLRHQRPGCLVFTACILAAHLGGDGLMMIAGVEGVVSSGASDLLAGRDLFEKPWQHRRITDVAGGEICGLDFRDLSSIPMWILRETRRFVRPCLRAFHLPSPLILIPGCRSRGAGPPDPRQGCSP